MGRHNWREAAQNHTRAATGDLGGDLNRLMSTRDDDDRDDRDNRDDRDDAALLSRMAQGDDQQALQELYARYRGPVWRYIWRLVNDEPWRRAYVVFKQGADTRFIPEG